MDQPSNTTADRQCGDVWNEVADDARLAAIDAAIDVLASLTSDGVAALSDPDLVALTRKTEHASHLIEAVQVTLAEQVRRRSAPYLEEQRLDHKLGATGPGSALMELTGASRSEANKRLRAASALLQRESLGQAVPPLHPVTGAALIDGRLGVDASLSIVKHLETIADRVDPSDLADAETALVGFAVERGADVIPALAARIRDLLDPDGPEPRDHERRRARFLRLTQQADGMLKIDGLADPESAARLLDALGPVEQTGPSFRTAREIEDDAAADPRTVGQKLLDRFVHTVTAGADYLDSNRATRRRRGHRIVVVANWGDLQSGEGVARFLGTNQVIRIERLKEIAASQGANGIETALFGDNGRLLALGRRSRAYTQIQRFGLMLRDGPTCARPGCTTPADDCDAHHIREWANGGHTDVDNGVLLCRYHHWLLHHAGGALITSQGRAYYQPPKEVHSRWQLLGDPPPPRRRHGYTTNTENTDTENTHTAQRMRSGVNRG